MRLYHGTIYDIMEIDLSKSNSAKDFGKGFYLSPDKLQAERRAMFKSKQLNGTPKVYEFEFDENILQNASSGLYIQSPQYVYEELMHEIHT